MMQEEVLRQEVVRVSHAVYAKDWGANHDGNVTARLADGRYVSTPTAVSKGEVTPEMLIVVDGEGPADAGNLNGTKFGKRTLIEATEKQYQ